MATKRSPTITLNLHGFGDCVFRPEWFAQRMVQTVADLRRHAVDIFDGMPDVIRYCRKADKVMLAAILADSEGCLTCPEDGPRCDPRRCQCFDPPARVFTVIMYNSTTMTPSSVEVTTETAAYAKSDAASHLTRMGWDGHTTIVAVVEGRPATVLNF